METQESSAQSPGLIAGITGMGRNLFGLLLSRMELAGLEFSEARTKLLKLQLISALGIMAAWFAVAYWSVLITYLAWPTLGAWILGILAVVFTAAAVVVGLYVRAMLKRGALSMPLTMAELRKDRDALL